MTNGTSGELRTAVFDLASVSARGGFAETNGFRIVRLSGGDLIAQIVRVIKWSSGL